MHFIGKDNIVFHCIVFPSMLKAEGSYIPPDTHILYTAISGDSIIANSCNYLNNEVVTHKIVYDESYGNGLLVNVAWVKNGKVYTHSAELRKPLPDKKLRMAWTTFRDRLTPGQQEEWTLSISQPDGTPAEAQLIATLYDASLDKIAPHQWRNQDPRWLNMPSASWRTGHSHALWFQCGLLPHGRHQGQVC